MLSALFLKVLDMSAAASVAILAVALARIPLKLFPKVLSYALWLVVLIRLLCPFAIRAPFSLVPKMEPMAQVFGVAGEAASAPVTEPRKVGREDAAERMEESVGEVPTASDVEERSGKTDWRGILLSVGKYVWLTGTVGLPMYDFMGYLRLKRGVRDARRLRENIFVAKSVRSPFALGLVRPKIYLPEGLDDRTREFVILHEWHHIRRLDHVFKALGFLALSIHWFNPLAWLAFALASADMEMSCDEAVVRALGDDARADYCASLLTMASNSKILVHLPKEK